MRRRLRAEAERGLGGGEIGLGLLPVLLRRAIGLIKGLLPPLGLEGELVLGHGSGKIAFGLQHVGGLSGQNGRAVCDLSGERGAGNREAAIGRDIAVGDDLGMEDLERRGLDLERRQLFLGRNEARQLGLGRLGGDFIVARIAPPM